MNGTTGIQPSTLVRADPVPTAPEWQVSPGMALGIAIGLSLLIAVPVRLRIQRNRMDPRDLAFARMARKLRLNRNDRGTMRHLAAALTNTKAMSPSRSEGVPSDTQIEVKVSPASLLLSERAFLKGAAGWISEADSKNRAAKVVTLQRKVFAPRRKG
ncbi:MAG: hypothetical protein H7210_12470 [Pyrinomonadaceae bacterium]|nr:hypothetical protein [Phycisphaerales bacterium]